MKRTTVLSLAAAALLGPSTVAVAASSTDTPPRPARLADITFVKHLTDPATFTFQGRTGGALRGDLTSQLVRETSPATDQYQFIEFRWTVNTRHRHLVAITDGTLNKQTGEVAMTGTVTSGWHQGADVLERGRLIDAATYTFAGDLVLLSR